MDTQLLRYSTLPPIPCAQRHSFGRTGRTKRSQPTWQGAAKNRRKYVFLFPGRMLAGRSLAKRLKRHLGGLNPGAHHFTEARSHPFRHRSLRLSHDLGGLL